MLELLVKFAICSMGAGATHALIVYALAFSAMA